MTEQKQMTVEMSWMDNKPDKSLPLASADIAHAREQGTHAFMPCMVRFQQSSHKCCPYKKQIYREAYHYGFTLALAAYLKLQMLHISSLLKEPFLRRTRNTFDLWEMP